jgi:hypothetical protein
MDIDNESKPKKSKNSFEFKKEFNEKGTLSAMIERQQRLSKIKERKHKINENQTVFTGIQLLYYTLKNQNNLLLDDLQEVFSSNLPYNCDLKPNFIKPPYLTPKIISHKIERTMNIV